MGHWHLIVRDVADAKKFWMLFGADPITVDESAVMKLPGILVFLTPGTPSEGSAGTSVNHVGLKVSNGQALKDKLKAAAVNADPTDPLNGRPSYWKPGLPGWGDVYSSDGLKLAMLDNIVEGEEGQREHLVGIVDPSRKKELPPVASE
jgi:hypothetical protein